MKTKSVADKRGVLVMQLHKYNDLEIMQRFNITRDTLKSWRDTEDYKILLDEMDSIIRKDVTVTDVGVT